jgi:hypothetical protein
MQQVPLKLACASPVQFIAQNGMTQTLEMDPNLVGPAGQQTTENERIVAKLLQHFKERVRTSSPVDNGHFLAMDRMPADRRGDLTLFDREPPLTEGQVIFLYLPIRKLPTESLMREVIFRYDQASARFLIEPMHDTGPQFSTDSAQRGAVV